MTPRPADTPRRLHKHAKSQVDGSLKTDSTQAESKRSRPLAQHLTLRGEVLGHHAALQPIKRSEAELREIYGEPVVTLEDCDTGKSLSMPLSEYAKRPECLQNQKKWLAREMLREIYEAIPGASSSSPKTQVTPKTRLGVWPSPRWRCCSSSRQ